MQSRSMIGDGAGAAVGAARGIAWLELPPGPAGVLRVARRLAGARRSAAAARAALRARAPRLDGAALVRARAYNLARLASELCARSGVTVALSGAIPRGPVVLVANHASPLDAIVVTTIMPALPIVRREVARWPVIGSLGREHGVPYVERGTPASGARALRAAGRALAAGVSVLDFPEGATAAADRVPPFRRGIFGLARLADVPVVPVALAVDDPELAGPGDGPFLPHLLRTLARAETVVRLRFGCAMTPRRYGGAEDLAREAHAVVEHLLAA